MSKEKRRRIPVTIVDEQLYLDIDKQIQAYDRPVHRKAREALVWLLTACEKSLRLKPGVAKVEVLDDGGIDFILHVGVRRIVVPVKPDGRIAAAIVSCVGSRADSVLVPPSTVELVAWAVNG
jgi:hypothetical protein